MTCARLYIYTWLAPFMLNLRVIYRAPLYTACYTWCNYIYQPASNILQLHSWHAFIHVHRNSSDVHLHYHLANFLNHLSFPLPHPMISGCDSTLTSALYVSSRTTSLFYTHLASSGHVFAAMHAREYPHMFTPGANCHCLFVSHFEARVARLSPTYLYSPRPLFSIFSQLRSSF